jgi:hypothetical protein
MGSIKSCSEEIAYDITKLTNTQSKIRILADTTLIINKIRESKGNNIRIYPNPTNRFINVNTYANIKNIDIYNIYGMKVFTQTIFENNKIEIDLGEFDSGTYLVRIITDNGVFQSKIIKK